MIKKIILINILFFVSMFSVIVILLTGMSTKIDDVGDDEGIDLPNAVLKWEKDVRKEAKLNGIEEDTYLLLGIIAQETGGDSKRYPDIMQCSESLGLPPNTIKDPLKSIKQGVKYFGDMIHSHPKMEALNIVQAYNYGSGYLNYSGAKYSFEEAKQFSKQKSNGKKVAYLNEFAFSMGYNWRYAYGNMFYAQMVGLYSGEQGGGHGSSNKLVSLALKELGHKNDGGEKFWRWYGFTSRVEWCATFVSYLGHKAGLSFDKFAYCPTGITNFKLANQWLQGGKTPKPGNIIFYDWNNDGISDHVGIVKEAKKGKVYTIEGNTGYDPTDRVGENSMAIGSSFIMGYGTP